MTDLYRKRGENEVSFSLPISNKKCFCCFFQTAPELITSIAHSDPLRLKQDLRGLGFKRLAKEKLAQELLRRVNQALIC